MKIEKTKTGKYTTRVCVTDAGGARHWRRFTDRSKDRVRIMAQDFQNKQMVYAESMALCDAAQRYIDHAEKILSPNTVRGYKVADRGFKEHYSAFYNKSIDRITTVELQFVIDDMHAKGKSPKTIANRIGFLSTVFGYEGRELPRHTYPRREQFTPNVPTQDLIQQVAATAAGTRYEIPLALAVFGLRCGEVCAVRAEDISDDNVLHVHRSIAIDDDGFLIEKAPKERASDRFIVIPASLADAIRAQGRATTMSPRAWSRAFPDLLERAGIPKEQRFRLHDCRHFFVSYCHDVLKLSDAQIIKLSGHQTDYVMKRVYRHAISDSAAQVSSNLGNLLSAAGGH